MIPVVQALSAKMGELLGPRSVVEIVITLYDDDRINYQLEGMNGPVSPGMAYKLLETVAREIGQSVQTEMQHITTAQEAPK